MTRLITFSMLFMSDAIIGIYATARMIECIYLDKFAGASVWALLLIVTTLAYVKLDSIYRGNDSNKT